MEKRKLINELIDTLKSNDESERLYAAHDIALTKDGNAAIHLIDLLQNESSQLVRDAVVFALKAIPCSQSYDNLFSLFISYDAFLRNQAVAVFGSEGNEAIPFLTSNLDHSNQEVRKLILDALFEIGTDDAIAAIRAYINDSAENVRIAAVEYLGRLNDKKCIPDLIELFKAETEAMLRSSIIDTLSIIGDAEAIKTVVDIINPRNNIDYVTPPLYLPQLVTMVCKAGDKQEVITVIEAVGKNLMFSDDIIAGMQLALRRFPDILLHKELCDWLMNLLDNHDIRDDVKISVAEILANKAYVNVLTPQELFIKGIALLEIPVLAIGGLNLLKASGTGEAKKRIDEELKKTQNVELMELYEDLFNGSIIKTDENNTDCNTQDTGIR